MRILLHCIGLGATMGFGYLALLSDRDPVMLLLASLSMILVAVDVIGGVIDNNRISAVTAGTANPHGSGPDR